MKIDDLKLNPNKVCNTIMSKSINDFWHWKEPYCIAPEYIRRLSTFPEDYNNLDINIGYLSGMSVPPIMMAQISYKIYEQIFKNNINLNNKQKYENIRKRQKK